MISTKIFLVNPFIWDIVKAIASPTTNVAVELFVGAKLYLSASDVIGISMTTLDDLPKVELLILL